MSSVRASAHTTTDALLAATAYYGGTVSVTTTAIAVNIRRGAVGGAIVDVFRLPAATVASSENHALTKPVQCPEGVFVDVDASTANCIVYVE